MSIKFAFFGTDQFSITVLNTLKGHGFTPAVVVTVPDKPKGRKLILTPPPAKVWAQENNVSVIQPEKLKDFILPPVDVAIVASYGKILPNSLLQQPKQGFINVHPSLLPKYRGATPLEAAILAGDQETGVTIIQLDSEMDHGPIIAQKSLRIADEWLEELTFKLATLGGEMLAEIIPDYVLGQIKPKEQAHNEATYTKKINKEDGLINLNDSAELNYRKIRACTPWPGAYFFYKDKRVIIKKAHLEEGQLVIDRVVPEGKKETDYKNFIKESY